jgi:hypothetical protein
VVNVYPAPPFAPAPPAPAVPVTVPVEYTLRSDVPELCPTTPHAYTIPPTIAVPAAP